MRTSQPYHPALGNAGEVGSHGVSFLEAASVFDDEFSITFRDPDHSADEERFVIIGHSDRGRLLFVSHTDQDARPRIISAREVTRRERKVYENVR